jgi:hypothetical protein
MNQASYFQTRLLASQFFGICFHAPKKIGSDLDAFGTCMEIALITNFIKYPSTLNRG